jgi:N-acyl-D-amino-acid deacylase
VARRRIHDEGKGRKPGPAGAGYDERYMSSIVISHCPPHPEYDGRCLHEVAAERGQDSLDAAMDILIESALNTSIIIFSMKEENVALGLRQPWVMIGTDGASRYFEGPHTAGKPHPRNFGTFPRVLGKYCREDGLFPLEEAVPKMTSLPAGKFHLRERGVLREGYHADIVILDAQAVADAATFADPRQRPRGIPWVFVNGKAAIAEGRQTGARPGRVLRHGG